MKTITGRHSLPDAVTDFRYFGFNAELDRAAEEQRRQQQEQQQQAGDQ